MSTDPELTASSAGRQVKLTPVPPGFWLIIGGGLVAALGPMFGFLIGSVIGSTTDRDDLSPIYLFLFGGIVIGGLGVGAVLLMHAVHALLDLSPDARVEPRGSFATEVLDEFSSVTTPVVWPSGLDRCGPDDGSATCALLAGCQAVDIVDGRDRLSIVIWRPKMLGCVPCSCGATSEAGRNRIHIALLGSNRWSGEPPTGVMVASRTWPAWVRTAPSAGPASERRATSSQLTVLTALAVRHRLCGARSEEHRRPAGGSRREKYSGSSKPTMAEMVAIGKSVTRSNR